MQIQFFIYIFFQKIMIKTKNLKLSGILMKNIYYLC